MQGPGITLSILPSPSMAATLSAPMRGRNACVHVSMCLRVHTHFTVTGSSSHGEAHQITPEINTAKHIRGNRPAPPEPMVHTHVCQVSVDNVHTDKSRSIFFFFFKYAR